MWKRDLGITVVNIPEKAAQRLWIMLRVPMAATRSQHSLFT